MGNFGNKVPHSFSTAMNRSVILLATTSVLLGLMLLSADLSHASLIEACVCVVNSAARAAVALGVSTAFGSVIGLGWILSSKVERILEALQVVAFIVALFFVVQHVFFVLELA